MALGRLWRAWLWRITRPKIELVIHRIECPYDELEISRRFPNSPMSLQARLLLCEGYRRVDATPWLYTTHPDYDRHDDAHQTAQALACCEFD